MHAFQQQGLGLADLKQIKTADGCRLMLKVRRALEELLGPPAALEPLEPPCETDILTVVFPAGVEAGDWVTVEEQRVLVPAGISPGKSWEIEVPALPADDDRVPVGGGGGSVTAGLAAGLAVAGGAVADSGVPAAAPSCPVPGKGTPKKRTRKLVKPPGLEPEPPPPEEPVTAEEPETAEDEPLLTSESESEEEEQPAAVAEEAAEPDEVEQPRKEEPAEAPAPGLVKEAAGRPSLGEAVALSKSAAAAVAAKTAEDAELKCPICIELMQRPVTLSCGHSGCKACLLKTVQRQLACPTCREPSSPHAVDQLSVNYALQNMIAPRLESRGKVATSVSSAHANLPGHKRQRDPDGGGGELQPRKKSGLATDSGAESKEGATGDKTKLDEGVGQSVLDNHRLESKMTGAELVGGSECTTTMSIWLNPDPFSGKGQTGQMDVPRKHINSFGGLAQFMKANPRCEVYAGKDTGAPPPVPPPPPSEVAILPEGGAEPPVDGPDIEPTTSGPRDVEAAFTVALQQGGPGRGPQIGGGPLIVQKPPQQQGVSKTKPIAMENALANLEHVKTTFTAEPKACNDSESSESSSASSKPSSYAPPQPNTVAAEGGIEEIKSYDLEFPVEVDMPGVGTVEKTIGWNRDERPEDVASRFLKKHSLPAENFDSITVRRPKSFNTLHQFMTVLWRFEPSY